MKYVDDPICRVNLKLWGTANIFLKNSHTLRYVHAFHLDLLNNYLDMIGNKEFSCNFNFFPGEYICCNFLRTHKFHICIKHFS